MFIFVKLGCLLRKSLKPHRQLDRSQWSSCQRQAGACAYLNMCLNLKTHNWTLFQLHLLVHLYGALHMHTYIWFQYDNEIKEQSYEWLGCCTISWSFRQVHFLAAGMWFSRGSYITATATLDWPSVPDLWIRCVKLYTPSGVKPVWFCHGQLNSPRSGLQTVIWWTMRR